MDVLNGLALRSRRITGLADPTGAQDAATKAYVDAHAGGGGGWTQIGTTLTTTSGASATFTAIPTTYSDLLLVFEGMSHNSGTNQQFTIEFSDDGTAWATVQNLLAGAVSAADTMYGSMTIPAYRKPAGLMTGSLVSLAADRTSGIANARGYAWRIAAGIAAIRIGVSAGAFDGGTIKLFGRC